MEPDHSELIVKLEEAGVKQEEIDLVVSEINKNMKAKNGDSDRILNLTIKQQIIEEDDWKKRARLAALLISSEIDV